MGNIQSNTARKKGRLEQGLYKVSFQRWDSETGRAAAVEIICHAMKGDFYSGSYFNGYQSIPVD